jgi:hypothetical protein
LQIFDLAVNTKQPVSSASAAMQGKERRHRSSSFDRAQGRKLPRKIRVGVCARDKKAFSKPMAQILSRFDPSVFDVLFFGDEVILTQPIEKWPVVDCLMSWYSAGFPLAKAEAYVRLRGPFSINDLGCEHALRDRRLFYAILEANHIPTPQRVVVNRDGATPTRVLELEDAIEVGGVRINKPFVEKPVDAEDHNIHIYYPRRCVTARVPCARAGAGGCAAHSAQPHPAAALARRSRHSVAPPHTRTRALRPPRLCLHAALAAAPSACFARSATCPPSSTPTSTTSAPRAATSTRSSS